MHMPENRNLHQLLAALQKSRCFSHPVARFELIETHISFVLLTGPFAYKFKKAVNPGFLDFSTLERRKFYLNEELRLNRRLAPDLYLAVIAISGTEETPEIIDPAAPDQANVIEYALKMRQFPISAQFDFLLEHNQLMPGHIDQLARQMAKFHTSLPPASTNSPFGNLEQIRYPALENFDQIQTDQNDAGLQDKLSILHCWTNQQLQLLEPDFIERKQQGWIRECHGDMHLSNMVLIDNKVVIFDCIEFNETFRWIDVISEIAFALMDLDIRDRSDLANHLLNAYLELTGDYKGLSVLNFYRVYRSMVRAKVAHMQRQQTNDPVQRETLQQRLMNHVTLAEHYTQSGENACLLITHGFSGSGKTTCSRQLADVSGMIHIRSDVERKRLFNLLADSRTDARPGEGLYQTETNEKTYLQLAMLARLIIKTGYSVIVDATFLAAEQRERFRRLAEQLAVPFHIVDFTAPVSNLKTRITERHAIGKDASDADLAVLTYQLEHHDELSDNEWLHTLVIDTEKPFNARDILTQLQQYGFGVTRHGH